MSLVREAELVVIQSSDCGDPRKFRFRFRYIFVVPIDIGGALREMPSHSGLPQDTYCTPQKQPTLLKLLIRKLSESLITYSPFISHFTVVANQADSEAYLSILIDILLKFYHISRNGCH